MGDCFIFESNQFLLNQIYLGYIFCQKKIKKAEGCNKESQTSSGNYLFWWKSIISRKIISVENSQYSWHRIFWCSISAKKWDRYWFISKRTGRVCFALKRGYSLPLELKGHLRIKMSRRKLLQSQPLQELVTNSFNKSRIYTQTFRKQINK